MSHNFTQVELPGVGWLYSEGRADAHLQLEQQLLERLAPKSPLVSQVTATLACASHALSCNHMNFSSYYRPALARSGIATMAHHCSVQVQLPAPRADPHIDLTTHK